MAGRQIYNPEGFKNIEKDGSLTGFEFQLKISKEKMYVSL